MLIGKLLRPCDKPQHEKKMKKKLQFAIAVMLLFSACSKEELTPPSMQPQSTFDVRCSEEEPEYDSHISLDEARQDLETLLADFASLSKSGNGGFSSRKIADGFTLKSTRPSLSKSIGVADTAKIHVFNFEDNGGFAIMSATREMPSLLAITDGGNIDTNEVIDDPGLIMFLSNLEGKPLNPSYTMDPELKNVGTDSNGNKVIVDEDIKYTDYDNTIYNPIGGFCRVHWGQRSPYNKFCPIIDGDTSLTGCVATACAQLMSIYKYPNSYGGYYFHWNDMISGKNTDDIARLMQQIGLAQNVDMDYGVNRSGADPANIPRTLVNFGYSCGGTLKNYDKNEVVDEIKNGYSVLLGGFTHKYTKKILGIKVGTSYDGGHRWLAHGVLTRTRGITYKKVVRHLGTGGKVLQEFKSEGSRAEKDDYILCNFGWGDYYYNGYYLGDVFDAVEGPKFGESFNKSNRDNYYQYKLTAVIGIRK